MDILVWFSVRSILGLFIAAVLGAAGFFGGSMLSSPTFGASLAPTLRICGVGIGASVGAFFAWLRPEDTRTTKVATLGWTLLGGLVGAWGGYLYGGESYGQGSSLRATHFSIVLGGAVASNAISMLINICWFIRHRRL